MLGLFLFTTWVAVGASMRVREEAHHLPASFLNSHEKIREEGLEAELSQLEQPHLATVVSTQYDCSIFKTAFTPSFLIATSTCFSYRNSRTGSLFPSSPSSAVTRPVTISYLQGRSRVRTS